MHRDGLDELDFVVQMMVKAVKGKELDTTSRVRIMGC